MIYVVDVVTTKMSITIHLYGPFSCHRKNKPTEFSHEIALQYCFPREQTSSADFGWSDEEPTTRLISTVILMHAAALPRNDDRCKAAIFHHHVGQLSNQKRAVINLSNQTVNLWMSDLSAFVSHR
ncbi:hypothetical protein [Bradyrhizobium sp. WSM1743]|uniref:hypothetical protein n=1 Tax=Bradyrhizobium sp. WSM1743 TaxID=318996 RepID=UPI001FD8A137|nr:hypothetical protein [Bradyrhizobium sp. WSM1743]